MNKTENTFLFVINHSVHEFYWVWSTLTVMADTTNKRPHDEVTGDTLQVQKKRKTTKLKRKDTDGRDDEGKAGAPTLLYFEEQKEAALLMQDISGRRRQNSKAGKGSMQSQLLSEWRLFQEIVRQQKDPAGGSGLSALRREGKQDAGQRKKIAGFDPEVLDILQMGSISHLRDIMIGASRIAAQRRQGDQKPEGFTVVEDVRIGLGEIRKRDEEAAKEMEKKEQEMLLKEAANRRANEETREKAQKIKEQMAGKQQAVAANKALAATLGGGDAKWMKWAAEGTPKPAATTAAMGDADKLSAPEHKESLPQEDSKKGESKGAPDPRILPSEDLTRGKMIAITVDDIVNYVESRPEYANSPVLYKLLHLKSM